MQKFDIARVEETVGGKTISIETGLMGRQADGAVTVQLGDTVIFAAAVSTKEQKPGVADFVPLTVIYKERTYAAGKIPGGFFKREGRPTTKEVLSSRLSDRAVRPLFPDGYNVETNVTSMVISSDAENDADVLGIIASSTALMISSIPFKGPVAAVRVVKKEGNFIINPTVAERKDAELEIVVAGTTDGFLMVEGGAKEAAEADVLKAMEIAKPHIDALCAMQSKLAQKVGKKKFSYEAGVIPEEFNKAGEEIARPAIKKLVRAFHDKETLDNAVKTVKKELAQKFEQENEDAASLARAVVENIVYEESRKLVLDENVRVDGRKPNQVRPIDCRNGLLKRTHGSALFTRGQTQALSVCTLGTPDDMQLVEGLGESYRERFMLHYNFPGYATNECKPDRSPGRREIGHGALARRALEPLVPSEENFGYTIRIVSDVMESNGSSSMATVCAGSLSMFDAGVPLKNACAGIAMGLIKEGDKYAVLSDIMGMEDHLGDMDFKLAGTRNGVTAFQMDVKTAGGISFEILKEAVAQAVEGRAHILEKMETALKQPKEQMSVYAPRLFRVQIPQDKIGALIGPGGKNIRRITEETGAKIEVNDDGVVYISGVESEKIERAKKEVEAITAEVEVGKVYKGKVVSIQPFGAFVEVLPGKEGLLHISEIANKRINKVEDVLEMGQEIDVKVIEADNMGKFRLSRKALL